MSTPGPSPAEDLVRLARGLERMLARRRKIRSQLADLEHDIRTTRKFINDLTSPYTPVDAGELPVIPMERSAPDGA